MQIKKHIVKASLPLRSSELLPINAFQNILIGHLVNQMQMTNLTTKLDVFSIFLDGARQIKAGGTLTVIQMILTLMDVLLIPMLYVKHL